jgi:hypothetical protein
MEEKARREEQLEQLKADLDTERRGPQSEGGRDTMWAPHDPRDDDPISDASRTHAGPRGSGAQDAEAGKGSRHLRALRNRIQGNRESETEADTNANAEDEQVDPEDAQAYADFVKYLEALEVSRPPASSSTAKDQPS